MPDDSTTTPPPEAAPADARRLRLITPQEQLEFTRLARRLLSHGISDADLRQELGYDTDEELKRAVETGRATTARLERLRSLAWDRMHLTSPPRPTGEAEGTGHIPALEESRGRGSARGGESGGRVSAGGSEPGRRPAAGGRTAARQRRTPKKRSARKEFLDAKQHAKLVEHVDHFRAVDRQFETWSLLAKVMGLASGQAAKRAYEVNSSLATLQHVERFARLLAGFGSRATKALQAGVPIEELQDFLTAGGTRGVESLRDPAAAGDAAAGGSEDAPARDGVRRRRRRQPREGGPGAAPHGETLAAMVAASSLPRAAATAMAPNLFDVAAAVDAELARIWESARFFDGVARTAGLPRSIRFTAEETRDMLQAAVEAFTGQEPETGPEGAEASVDDADEDMTGLESTADDSLAGEAMDPAEDDS
jgi:hypothetical protein